MSDAPELIHAGIDSHRPHWVKPEEGSRYTFEEYWFEPYYLGFNVWVMQMALHSRKAHADEATHRLLLAVGREAALIAECDVLKQRNAELEAELALRERVQDEAMGIPPTQEDEG